MIAKIIPIKSIRKSSFSALVKYLTHPQGKSERISKIQVANCYTDELPAAVLEILNTQDMNTRTRSDKTCHLVLSFPEGERLSHAELNVVEARFCDALGFKDHQRVSVIHDDTDYQHMHIAINKIHPRRLTIHHPYYDYKIVAQVCEQIEQEYGLTKINHKTGKDHATRVAQDIEARTGVESLLGWIKREVLTDIKRAENWQDLHQVLARHSLEIKQRSNGLIITANNGMAVKASSVDRSLSKGNLTQRLGVFVPSESTSTQRDVGRVIRQFQSRPLQTGSDTSKLYARYQEEQSNLTQQRSIQWTRLRHARDQLIERAKREAELKRGVIKHIQAGRLAKKALFATAHLQYKTQIQVIKNDYREAYQNSKTRHSKKGWLDWLTFEARSGNAEALAVLRTRGTGQFKGNQILAQESKNDINTKSQLSSYIKDSSIESITKIGTVTYQTGSTIIRDNGNRLIVRPEASGDALRDILRVAMKKFGNCLAITGTEQFRLNLAKAAVQNHMRLTFDDPHLEQYRQQLLMQNKVSTNPPEHLKRSVSSMRRSH